MQELKLKKCLKCHRIVKIINGSCPIMCCKEEMVDVIANSVDAAFEKHIPQYEVIDGEMHISVNHVMEDDHYIEWILVKYAGGSIEKYYQPGDEPTLVAPYEKGATIYSYCNKHELWQKEVE